MKKKQIKALCLCLFTLLSIPFCLAQNKTLSIPIAANDIVYDSSRQLIYATVRSEDSYNFGNRVVAINPMTGKIVKNVLVGSQPMRMALTTGNAFLYVSLGGSPRIVRIKLENFEVDMDFLTTDSKQIEFDYAQDDIAVFPNKTDYVISTLSSAINQGLLDWGYGVSILQNGKQIQASINRTSVWGDAIVDRSKNVIGIPAGVFMSSLAVDSNIIVATEGYGAMIMTHTDENTFVPQFYYKGESPLYTSGASNARIAIDKRIIFTSAGKVVQVLPNYQLQAITTLPNASSPHRPFSFFMDKANNSVYYANTEGVNIKIKKYNKTTYSLDGEFIKAAVLPNAAITPRRFIKLGGNQAALIVQNEDRLNIAAYRIIILNLDNNTDALVNLERESKSATERTGTIISLPIAAEDIVFDSLRQRYYVSAKETDPIHAKSIITIDAKTLAVLDKKISLPETAFSPLIQSKDGKYLYFQQVIKHKIMRLDLNSWTITGEYDMGVHPFANERRFYFLSDGAAISDSIASLALVVADNYYASGAPKICLFDTAFNFIKAFPGFDALSIEPSANGKRLFAMDEYTTARFVKSLSVSNQSITLTKTYQKVASGGYANYKTLNNKIYSSNNLVIRTTDTVCFVDGYYPYFNSNPFTLFRIITPTDKGIFLTELEDPELPNLIIRNIDPKSLTLREISRFNNVPNLNYGSRVATLSAYDAKNATLGLVVEQTGSTGPNFQNKSALLFVRDFFTSNKEIQKPNFSTTTFSAYPNPFSNNITIKVEAIESLDNAKILVQDITGRVIDVLTLSNDTTNTRSINYQKGNLKSGFYFFTLMEADKAIKTIKVVKL